MSSWYHCGHAREGEKLSAGWGERACCLPAHRVISSRCGYCKWDGEENWKKGPQLPVKVMALGRVEYHSARLPLKHLAFIVEPLVWESLGIPIWKQILITYKYNSPGSKQSKKYYKYTNHKQLLFSVLSFLSQYGVSRTYSNSRWLTNPSAQKVFILQVKFNS